MSGVNLSKYQLGTYSKNKWQRVGTHKRAGVVVPLFSIYFQKSLGIGELEDLKLVIDWANKTGNSVIQLLPLNEFGPTFCPYDSLSSFALEPVYISLRMIPGAEKKSIKTKLENIRKAYPTGKSHVDYRIKKEKIELAWDIFNEEGCPNTEEFKKFIGGNSYWLLDFALFKVLKDYHRGRPWYDWEDRYKNRNIDELEIFKKEHEREILFQIWIQ
jgi:4-alpha-glucanotransferase